MRTGRRRRGPDRFLPLWHRFVQRRQSAVCRCSSLIDDEAYTPACTSHAQLSHSTHVPLFLTATRTHTHTHTHKNHIFVAFFLRDNKRYLCYFTVGSLQVRHEFKLNQSICFTNLSGASLDQIRWEQVSRERRNEKRKKRIRNQRIQSIVSFRKCKYKNFFEKTCLCLGIFQNFPSRGQ